MVIIIYPYDPWLGPRTQVCLYRLAKGALLPMNSPCMNPARVLNIQVCLYRLAKGQKVALYIAPGSKRSPGAVVDAITELKGQEPVMAWGIECYHYEMRTVTTWSSDANGNMYPVTSTVGKGHVEALPVTT